MQTSDASCDSKMFLWEIKKPDFLRENVKKKKNAYHRMQGPS